VIMGFEMKDTRLLVDSENATRKGTGPAVVWIMMIDEEKQRGTASSLPLLYTS